MDFDLYKNKNPYPIKPKKPEGWNRKISEVNESEIAGLTISLREYNAAMEKYYEEEREYREETSRLYQKFKDDLFKENGVTGNPKAQMAYDMAYDRGHSSGLEEVVYYFEELVELIK